jgi:hypothetical protein
MNDNEDQYKPIQSEYQGFTSLIIRGSLVRAQLGPLLIINHLQEISVSGFLFHAMFTPGFEEKGEFKRNFYLHNL